VFYGIVITFKSYGVETNTVSVIGQLCCGLHGVLRFCQVYVFLAVDVICGIVLELSKDSCKHYIRYCNTVWITCSSP